MSVAGLDALCGLVCGVSASAHLAGVLWQAYQGKGFAGAATFTYDFHFYSLVLFGVVVAVPGFWCLSLASALSRGEVAAWRTAFRWSLWLVVVNAPLGPPFAPLLAAVALVNVVTLALARKQFQSASH